MTATAAEPNTTKPAPKMDDKTIKDHVLGALGTPPNLNNVKIQFCEHGCHCRVNIYCKRPIPHCVVDANVLAHSYYLTIKDGKVVNSSPKIAKVY